LYISFDILEKAEITLSVEYFLIAEMNLLIKIPPHPIAHHITLTHAIVLKIL